VRDEEDGLDLLPPDAQQLHRQLLTGHGVEGAEWFIHEKDRGTEEERSADGHPLLHASRKLARILALETLQPHQSEQRQRALVGLVPVQAEDNGGEEDVIIMFFQRRSTGLKTMPRSGWGPPLDAVEEDSPALGAITPATSLSRGSPQLLAPTMDELVLARLELTPPSASTCSPTGGEGLRTAN
jgi:predicted PhzF superfamily epimerase YddE/YHI9